MAKRKGRTKIMKKYLLTDHEDVHGIDMFMLIIDIKSLFTKGTY